MGWIIKIENEKEDFISSERNEIKDFLATHHGKKYKIFKAETNVLYEAGLVDATSGDDLEYAHA